LEEQMKWHRSVGLLAAAGALAVSFTWVNAQQRSGATVAIDADDIGGVVTREGHGRNRRPNRGSAWLPANAGA